MDEKWIFDTAQPFYEYFIDGVIVIKKPKWSKKVEIISWMDGGPVVETYMMCKAMEQSLRKMFFAKSGDCFVFSQDRETQIKMVDDIFDLIKENLFGTEVEA